MACLWNRRLTENVLLYPVVKRFPEESLFRVCYPRYSFPVADSVTDVSWVSLAVM